MNLLNKIYKLSKALLQLGQIATDNGNLIWEGDEIAVDMEVFVEAEDGNLTPAPDGDYTTDDKIITVAGGKVIAITVKEIDGIAPTLPVEEPAEEIIEEMAEEETPVEEPAEPETDEKDAIIAELTAKIEELTAKIEELETENADLKAKLEEPAAEPAEEELKKFSAEKKGISFRF